MDSIGAPVSISNFEISLQVRNSMYLEFFINGMLATLLIQSILNVRRALSVAPNRLLFAFIILYTLHFINITFVGLNFPGLSIHFYKVPFVLNALLIPTAFLYVSKVVNQSTTFKQRDLRHLALPAFVLASMLPWYLESSAVKRQHWQDQGPHGGFTGNEQFVGLVMLISLLVYLIYQIKDYLKLAKGSFQSSDFVQSERMLKWISALNAFIASLTVLSMIYTLLRIIDGPEWLNAIFRVLWALCNISLFWFLNANPKILELLPSGHREVVGSSENVPNYSIVLEKSKAFLNPNLTVYQFSLISGTSVVITSREIKRQTGQTFNGLINSFRVRYFLERLRPDVLRNQTIEGLALDSGFKSRASFYRAFKLETGKTPTEWFEGQFGEDLVANF